MVDACFMICVQLKHGGAQMTPLTIGRQTFTHPVRL